MTFSAKINEDDIQRRSFKCSLGVNQDTGRVQWCAGTKMTKMCIIIPAALLPIIVVLVLLTQLNVVGTIGQESEEDYIVNAIDTDDNNDFSPKELKCLEIRYSMSEIFDNEESELFKDIRTSFIPPDTVVIPPHCKNKDIDWSDSNIKDAIDEKNRLSLEETFLSFLIRRRREQSYNKSEENEESTYSYNREENEEEDNKDAINIKEHSLEDNAELDVNANSKSTTSAAHAFWKGEGSYKQIRATQADVMLKYMDHSVDPCDDFYQYACGNWEKLNPIPKDKAGLDTFELLRESLDGVLSELLATKDLSDVHNKIEHTTILPPLTATEYTDSTTMHSKYLQDVSNILNARNLVRLRNKILRKRSTLESVLRKYNSKRFQRRIKRKQNYVTTEAEKKAKYLYESCMNYELIEKRGVAPLLELLDKLGGWPALNPDWDSENFDWLDLTARLRLYNNDIFLVQWVGPDIKNSDVNVIQFDQTSLGLPTRNYFLQPTNDKYLEAYREYMKTIITLLGANEFDAIKSANEIIEFETELAKSTTSPEERTNVSVIYNKMTIETLHEAVPEIDWIRYISIVQEKPVNQSEVVVMFALDYMKQLVILLDKTEPKTIANYLFWRFIRHRISNLDDRFQDAKQKFYFSLLGREVSPPRWKNCVNQVNTNMGMAVGAMFVRKYFDENSKKDTTEMTSEIQQSFREILNSTEWIDTPTKHLAELKVNDMSLRIGYPNFILSPEELNDKYKDLIIEPDKYFENTLNVLVHLTRTEQVKLGQPVNKTAWSTAPAVVNAYYSRNQNQIMFPAGILQPPFYHRYFPKSLNYGGIGVVIGHELTHGFDDKGRLFDREGNLHRWWSDASINGFHQRAKCLISQYGNYTVSEVGIAVDGENTQGENIADNGGIKQAFGAYKKWLENHQDPESMSNEVLSGINATNTQLFFLHFAQIWCGAMRPEASRIKLKTAVHSPGKFRVIGTLSNSEDFAKEYQCELGSPMNPPVKCSVW